MTQISLKQRSLIFLLCSIGLITLPHAWHISWPLFSFFAIILVWRFLAVWRRHWLPNRGLLFLLTLLAIALLIVQHRGLFGRDAGTALIVVALGLKLFEIRSRREIYLVVYLSFIVAASQFLYEQSIFMAGYIFLVCSALLLTLIFETTHQIPSRVAVKAAMAITLQALPLAIVIFMLFPRVEAPRWMWLQDNNKALSGLSNTLEPGSISDLSLSDELVFRVHFQGDLPPPSLRYWRGPVYTKTDGVRWFVADKNNQLPRKPEFSGASYSYTLLMEPQQQDWVFALEMVEQFDASLKQDALFQLRTNKRYSERAEYQLTSRTHYKSAVIGPVDYQDNLQLPVAPSAKQLQLIKALHGFEVQPEQFIQNLLNHFRQEKFYYTLTPPLMPDNPIDTFLFQTRSGFCSHYATAFVYLLRIAKIPARVVGGYQGGEFNKVGEFLEVRQADAHAWAEVWLENQGWVRFDPTAAIAPERIERGVNVDLQIATGAVNFGGLAGDSVALDWLKRGRQLWQSVDYSWQRWVINYNGANQAQFLQSLGIEDLTALLKWLIGSVLVVMLPLAWWLLRQKTKVSDKAVKYYRIFCAKLAKKGTEIHLGEGARAFSERAKTQYPDLADQIEHITALFIRLRYQANAQPSDLDSLRKQVRKLRTY